MEKKGGRDFLQGHEKVGGRKKGVANKVKGITRDTFADFLKQYYDSGMFTEDFKMLDPRDRFNAALKMATLVVPTPKSVDISITQIGNKALQQSLAELALEDESD